MITTEIEALRDAIDEATESDLRVLTKELCDKAEELDKDNNKLEDRIETMKEELQENRPVPFDYQTLQLKHPRLFTGDLSRLTHADRRELFEEIYNFEGHSAALSAIEHRIS